MYSAFNIGCCLLQHVHIVPINRKKLQEGDKKAVRLLEKVSPLATRHLNFCGIYHYDNEGQGINIDAIVVALNEALEKLMTMTNSGKTNSDQ